MSDRSHRPKPKAEQPAPHERPKAPPVLFTGNLQPLGWRVQSNPEAKLVLVEHHFGFGQLNVIWDADDELKSLIDNMAAAHKRASSGLIVPDGRVKGVVGPRG
jgi:hypothetical protein